MTMQRFSEPNWAQKVIADAVGLLGSVAVRIEDETKIVFLHHRTRDEISVDKRTGKVTVWENNAIKKATPPLTKAGRRASK